MSQQYYIAVNGQKTGPFSFEDLKSKDIQKDTLIWTEGLDNWTKADHIPLLKEILRSTPPPMPNITANKSSNIPPPPITNINSTDKYFGYELANTRKRLFATIVETIILLIPYMVLFGGSDDMYSFESVVAQIVFSAVLGAIFYSLWSGNLGHKLFGLKVISSVDGSDKNKALAGAYREGLKYLFGYVLIPVIWLLWDENKQNLYDKVAKTYVVKKKNK